MELSKINSLVELFFTKYKELNSTSNKPFLKWLKDNKKDFLTWKQVERNIQILSEYLRNNLSKGEIFLIKRAFLNVWKRIRHRRIQYPTGKNNTFS